MRSELAMRLTRALLFTGADREARRSLATWRGVPQATDDRLLRDLGDTYNRLEVYSLDIDVQRLRLKNNSIRLAPLVRRALRAGPGLLSHRPGSKKPPSSSTRRRSFIPSWAAMHSTTSSSICVNGSGSSPDPTEARVSLPAPYAFRRILCKPRRALDWEMGSPAPSRAAWIASRRGASRAARSGQVVDLEHARHHVAKLVPADLFLKDVGPGDQRSLERDALEQPALSSTAAWSTTGPAWPIPFDYRIQGARSRPIRHRALRECSRDRPRAGPAAAGPGRARCRLPSNLGRTAISADPDLSLCGVVLPRPRGSTSTTAPC